MAVTVRPVQLRDVPDVVSVYCSNTTRWRTHNRWGRRYLPYERLTLRQRCMNGGLWMDERTCAVHIQDLLSHKVPTLVAEYEGRVIGVSGLLVGDEPQPWGRNARFNTIYVHKDFQRKVGAGAALARTVEQEARAHGCDLFWAFSVAPDAVGFYKRLGFGPLARQVKAIFRSRPFRVGFEMRAVDSTAPPDLNTIRLAIGHRAPSQWSWASHERWHKLCKAFPDSFSPRSFSRFVLRMESPGAGKLTAYVDVSGDPRYETASVLVWSANPDLAPIVECILTHTHHVGFRKTEFLFQESDWQRLKDKLHPERIRLNTPWGKKLA